MDYKVGQKIKTSNGMYEIIEIFKRKEPSNDIKEHFRTCCKCKCLIDGNVFELLPKQIKQGIGCNVCSGKKIIKGINSFSDVYPEYVQFFDDKSIADSIAPNSNKKFLMRCPCCGNTKFMYVCNLAKNGFKCNYCFDGISYPNKFVRNFLTQLGVDYIPEHKFSWSNGKIYDQYLPTYNIVIENHGKQHYTNGFLRDDISNDIIKKNLAKENGYIYVEIDCRKSEKEFIKNSILKSDLIKRLNFKDLDIDWDECDLFASSSIVKDVWDAWNKYDDFNFMLKKYRLTDVTLRNYIKMGINLGICSKDFYVNNGKSGDVRVSKEVNAIPLYSIEDNIYFFSAHVASDYYKSIGIELIPGSISRATNTNKSYKGKNFKKITKQEFNKIKEKSLNDNSINIIGDFFSEKYIR